MEMGEEAMEHGERNLLLKVFLRFRNLHPLDLKARLVHFVGTEECKGAGYSGSRWASNNKQASTKSSVAPVILRWIMGLDSGTSSSNSSSRAASLGLFVWQVPLLSWLVSPGGRLIAVADYTTALRNFLPRNAYDFNAQLVRS
ncbi:hypothetical protein V1478_010542 [Vespula squamosa]|uniref:Uncharacterized protein n=1 Tax=Vespula squamosa TaxID=30214 RepID=A0ABD2AIR6_VESSQ